MANRALILLKNRAIQYTVMSAIASGINFVTLIVFGRVFSVNDYGIVTTMQAFVANVAVFMTPLQILACKTIAENEVDNSKNLNSIINIMVVINAVEMIIFVCAAIYISGYLHFENTIDYLLFVILVFTNNVYLVLSGISQGKQDFYLLGLLSIVLFSVKMIISVVLGFLGIGPLAVVIGFDIAEIICLFMLLRSIRQILLDLYIEYKPSLNAKMLSNYSWSFLLYIIVSLYMNNGDLLLANFYCQQNEIGLYSVAINLSKISIFLIATPVATMLLPKVASKKGKRREQQKILYNAELITISISIAYNAVFYSLGKWIIRLLYGQSYEASSVYILPCAVFSVVLGAFWVFYQYAFATDLMKMFTTVTVSFGIVALLVILFSRCTIGMIPIVMTGAMIITMGSVMAINALLSRNNQIA